MWSSGVGGNREFTSEWRGQQRTHDRQTHAASRLVSIDRRLTAVSSWSVVSGQWSAVEDERKQHKPPIV